jgi:very-short-patch-repair endonuclease
VFAAPPNAGVAPGGQRKPSALAGAASPWATGDIKLSKPNWQDWLTKRFRLDRAESPIEALFYAAFEVVKRLEFDLAAQCVLKPQHHVGDYRIDFAIGGAGKLILIELDGHEFHERTKEQAEKDKSRDRELQRLGHDVLRFTGSEVNRNPFECAESVINHWLGLVHGTSIQKVRTQHHLDRLNHILGED